MNPILPVPITEYHILPSLSIANANGSDSLSGNVISSNVSSSGEYFTILFLLIIVI